MPWLEGLADMLLLLRAAPDPVPVVMPFFTCFGALVAPGPTLPSLEAPGAAQRGAAGGLPELADADWSVTGASLGALPDAASGSREIATAGAFSDH